QAEDGIRDKLVTGVQTCALPIWAQLFALELFDAAVVLGHGHCRSSARDPGVRCLWAHACVERAGAEVVDGGSRLSGRDQRAAWKIGRASCRERVGVGEGRGRVYA